MSLPRQILADSPAAYWPLNDGGSTTTKDRSGNGRDLTWTAAPPAGSLFLPGGGVALAHDRDSIPAANAVWATTSGTVEFWCSTTYGSIQTPVSRRAVTGGPAFYDYIGGGGVWTANFDTTGGAASVTTAVPIVSGRLYYVALTWAYNGSTTSTILYLDGAQIGTGGPGTGAIPNSTDGPRVGGESGSRYWDGKLAHVAWYTSALSATRIKAHYEAGIRSGVLV